METLQEYLLQRLTKRTTKTYHRDIIKYILSIGEQKATQASYADVLSYIGTLRKHYKRGTVCKTLQSIKAYYQWLLDSGQRDDHPCRDLRLKDNKADPIQLQDLFTPQELEQLMIRTERSDRKYIKNKLIISLLVYQALMEQEIIALKLRDINLEEGTIYIKRSGLLNSRTLKLKARQVILLQRYLQEIRPTLKHHESELLLLSIRDGGPFSWMSIHYVVSVLKPLFPNKKLTTTTIRQSVITNLLKSGKDLRLVQTFAGHRWPSTTEKYKQTQVEELREAVMKFHPLR